MSANRSNQHQVALAALSLLAVASVGCGAMFGTKKRTVTITSSPPGAEAFVDGDAVGRTPVQVMLADNRAHEVVFRYGQLQARCQIESEIDATWLILDILAFPIGVVVDGVTGDWKELDRSRCHALLSGAPPAPMAAPPVWPPPGAVPVPAYGPPPASAPPPVQPSDGVPRERR